MLKKFTPHFGLKTCLMTLILFTGSAHSIMLDAVVSTPVVAVGDSFDVDLVISDLGNGVAPSVSAFDILLGYDSLVLSATGVIFSDLLNNGFSFDSIQDVTFSPNWVSVAELSFLEGSATECVFCFGPFLDDIQPDSFTLATVSFDAIGVGSSGLNFLPFNPSFDPSIIADIKDSDLAATVLPVTVNNGTVNVLPRAVPEPHVMLLIMMGLITTTYLKRNKQVTLS